MKYVRHAEILGATAPPAIVVEVGAAVVDFSGRVLLDLELRRLLLQLADILLESIKRPMLRRNIHEVMAVLRYHLRLAILLSEFRLVFLLFFIEYLVLYWRS